MWSISFIDAAVKRRTRIITVVGIDENDKKDGSTMLWGGNFSKAPNAQPFFLQKVDLVFTSTSIASSGSCESGHRENALWVAAADPAPFRWAPHPGLRLDDLRLRCSPCLGSGQDIQTSQP